MAPTNAVLCALLALALLPHATEQAEAVVNAAPQWAGSGHPTVVCDWCSLHGLFHQLMLLSPSPRSRDVCIGAADNERMEH
eukprot:CAMPEP_0175842260 /NCGR_PEP_ID=MMETSP0107_2-20121207/20394_1 /TAXON_ID=195067 ORGANISM="Goniomonas pacifica, Strain CCMP1869" /NCGR_SAMPLE_ID=MMETSP0107_2 /ASSEMBLY_ACC=CAM_ASM_000203 /LENGTH=80 /DNA_ID=CAMNT_0017156335 /DNA_START=36 /DNA_END=276 /DNA_ORIENTATION=+